MCDRKKSSLKETIKRMGFGGGLKIIIRVDGPQYSRRDDEEKFCRGD